MTPVTTYLLLAVRHFAELDLVMRLLDMLGHRPPTKLLNMRFFGVSDRITRKLLGGHNSRTNHGDADNEEQAGRKLYVLIADGFVVTYTVHAFGSVTAVCNFDITQGGSFYGDGPRENI